MLAWCRVFSRWSACSPATPSCSSYWPPRSAGVGSALASRTTLTRSTETTVSTSPGWRESRIAWKVFAQRSILDTGGVVVSQIGIRVILGLTRDSWVERACKALAQLYCLVNCEWKTMVIYIFIQKRFFLRLFPSAMRPFCGTVSRVTFRILVRLKICSKRRVRICLTFNSMTVNSHA